MKILIAYRGAQRIREWETGNLFARAFEKLGHDVTRYGFVYETGEWFCDQQEVLEQHYDLCVYMEHNDPSAQPIELKDLKCDTSVFCVYDVSYYPNVCRALSAHMEFDHVFCANDKFIIDDFWGCDVKYLPYAADTDLHFRPVETPKQFDVGLVGTDRPARRELIKKLQVSGINAKLISNVFKSDYVDALAGCKVVINENPPEGRGLLNMRHFEAQAAGACLVSGDALQENTSHFVSLYDNDPVGPCRVLLETGAWLRGANENQSHVSRFHTYQHRAQTILETLYG